MFDVFDVLIPCLVVGEGIQVRQHQTAFGPDEREIVFVHDTPVGERAIASAVYTHLEGWTGSESRAAWTVIVAAHHANTAARSDTDWDRFLNALRHILERQEGWRVTCESDCDQHAIANLPASATELVAVLDRARSSQEMPISFRMDTATASSPE
ncbi:MAG: hypothetical protein KC766_23895 [Myxococcales bacterium]|nr:hypothetical protein [Myxococcales bacterium]